MHGQAISVTREKNDQLYLWPGNCHQCPTLLPGTHLASMLQFPAGLSKIKILVAQQKFLVPSN